MDTCTDASIGSWTRSKNDEISNTFSADASAEVFKHIVYTPEYLTQGSCEKGNVMNCNVFQSQDIENEPRFGKLTNLNSLQRATTNDTTLGIRTAPATTTGPLLDPRLIQDMSTLESRHTNQRFRSEFPSQSLMDAHQFDATTAPLLEPPFARDEIRISSRVSRRNTHSDRNCTKPR